jgi:heme-degrading monooxygenase HmoA
MWAQLMKMQVKPEKEQDLVGVFEQLQALEQPGSGLIRTMTMRDQSDPSRYYVLVVFESEEKARAREQDPRRQEGLKPAQAALAEILDGQREFVELTVVQDISNSLSSPDGNEDEPQGRHDATGAETLPE